MVVIAGERAIPGYAQAMNATAEAVGATAHHLIILDTPAALAGGAICNGQFDARTGVRLLPRPGEDAHFETAVLHAPTAFDSALISWNVDSPAECGFRVEMRVGQSTGGMSPWLSVGDWGEPLPRAAAATEFEGGRIKVDYFVGRESFERVQLRVIATTSAATCEPLRVARLAISLSRDGRPVGASVDAAETEPGRSSVLRVPFRSQKMEDRRISGRICSPTSVAMVMSYYGISRSTREIADRCFDPRHDIYGNWPRNIQAAYSFGCGGYLTRLSGLTEAERFIRNGRPLVLSIRVAMPGGLNGAPYRATEGHLLVLRGFDERGNPLVNDPAGADPASGVLAYDRAEFEAAWIGGSGGVAYVLLGPASKP